MTIKLKLLLIAGAITVAMLLSIASMRWSVATLNSMTETQAYNHLLLSDMLMLRRNEKDFLMRNDMKYLEKHNKNFTVMMENINKLEDLLIDHDIVIDNYGTLATLMKSYQSQFHQLVDITQQIGLDPKSGLRGTLRASVHKAEAIFKEVSNDTLLKDMLMLRRNEKDFLMRMDKKYIDKFNNNYQLFIDSINTSSLSDSQKTTLLKDVASYKDDFLKLTALTEKKGFGPKLGILGEMRGTIHKTEDILTELHEAIEAKIEEVSDSIQTVNLISSLIIAALVIGFALYLAQSISRSLDGFTETLKKICETGDLTQRVDDQGKDEIAEVGRNLNVMLSDFQNIVQRLHVASADLTQYAHQFMSIREDTFKNVEQQQAETEQVSTAMTEMSATAKNIAENTTRTADAAQQANNVTNEGKTIVDTTVASTQTLEQVINNASSVIQQLGEDSKSIGSILDVIRGIAEQTNLLALNAAIEAARAGEQGRGFAVVADEVRTLAQKTQDSISEIESMILSLQTGSNKAIDAISKGKEGVTTNVEHINAAGKKLMNIVTELDAINQMSHENASATEEQSIVAEEVNKNVVAIRDLGEQIVDNIELLNESSNKMGQLSSSMEELVKRFQA